MVGCSLLLQMSEALIEAKGKAVLFGGVNVIFAGDFAQLPPVGMKSLYAKINTDRASGSGKKAQETILGKLLWLSIKTVVILKRVERVRDQGNENTEGVRFVELLTRLRQGRCTDEDFDLLDSRLSNVPIIVSTNELKDVLNERAAEVFAAMTGQALHWYFATD
ncbi:hypothetical protein C8F01DRAFT_925353, partial [Mycena amicta]